MRLIAADDGSALDPASRSVRELLGPLDAGGLADLGERRPGTLSDPVRRQ